MKGLLRALRRVVPFRVKQFAREMLATRAHSISQAGQDAWVYGPVFNGKRNGYFVEVGAHDGLFLSNTFLLERRFGWRGLCVEPDPAAFARLVALRRATCLNACLDEAPGMVNFRLAGTGGRILAADRLAADAVGEGRSVRIAATTLRQVLDEQQAPRVIDYLSIDVEGAEERVLRRFDFDRYRFRCMTVERPPERLQLVLRQAGYRLVAEIPGLDHCYVHETFVDTYHRNVIDHFARQRRVFEFLGR